MKEIRDIIAAYDQAMQEGYKVALATVVAVEGSSYRRPGARMLVREDGLLTGAISGGCLEGDALKKALLALTLQRPLLATYDTTDEEDAVLGVGLGCNGIIRILLEPLQVDDKFNPVELLRIMLEKRQSAVIVSAFSYERGAIQPGTRCLLTAQDACINNFNGIVNTMAHTIAAEAMKNKASKWNNGSHEGAMMFFAEYIQPEVQLLIVGAGNDVMPLVLAAQIPGWQITVVDGRPRYACPARFPGANVLVARPQDINGIVAIDDRTVCALMTHNYQYDLSAMRGLLNTNTPYIGVLGPSKKLERMITELAAEGIAIGAQDRQRLHGPIGLDIGAETAEEIAISIVAEIKAVLTQANGKSLKEKKTPIHQQKLKAVTI